ncbi:MAG: DUF5702 domain-containing protein [Eubacteriales bacterium]|nr:DUF5702 domain-containing protein [Eubacteriales bacterium]
MVKRGTITVFLSLLSVLFLSLLCTVIESARIQGSRAKAASALDLGMFSVFGEFERELLEKYDVFFLDGGQGSGNYSVGKVNERLQDYMEYNVDSNKDLWFRGFDLFRLSLNGTKVTGVQLATDERGAPFYQQAVSFMKENLATELLAEAVSYSKDAQLLEKAAEEYEKKESTGEKKLSELEEKQREEQKQRESEQQAAREAAANGEEILLPQETEAQVPKIPANRNPLKVIRKLRKIGIMGLVFGKQKISSKKLPKNVPSRRSYRKGNLPVKKTHRGAAADLLFQNYLFQRFSLYTDQKREGYLDYALEYILCGKDSDEKNMKSVVTRLLLLREGANFAYLSGDPSKKGETDALATLLVGVFAIPELIEATSYALQLIWAYAESLVDVRELMHGGKVPIYKTAADWKTSLSSLPDLLEILEGTSGKNKVGVSYSGYLQMLFTLGKKKAYPMRALDMIEGCLREKPGTANFRADYAICKMETEADFEIPPVFLKVSAAFLKTGTVQTSYHASGSFAY